MALEDLYWNPVDFGSDDTLPRVPKQYIDPWDLENYAYIREHLDPTELSSSGPSSLDEPTDTNSSSFYYVPVDKQQLWQQNKYDSFATDRTNSNYAAIDELTLRRSKLRDSRTNYEPLYNKERDYVEPGADEAFEESNRDSSLLYIYETRGRCRQMALPSSRQSRERSMSFSYGDCGYDVYTHKQNIYSKLDDVYAHSDRISTTQSAYGFSQRKRKPNNFGLSNYGHLQIDYSYSWNNLDKYICK